MPVDQRADAGRTAPTALRRVVERSWPFVVVGVVAIVLQPLTGGDVDTGLWWSGIIATLSGTAISCWAMFDPRRRHIETATGLVCLAGIAVAREAAGGMDSGYGPLVLLPVAWFAFHGSRQQLLVVLGGVVAVLLGPPLVIGEPNYPASGWRGAFVLLAVALLFGLATQHLRHALARESAAARRLATQLRAALESFDDPIAQFEVVRDGAGRAVDLRCVLVNPPAEGVLGRDAVGQLLTDRLDTHGRTDMLQSWLRVLESGVPSTFELTSAHWRPGAIVVLKLTPLADGLLAAWHDVTEDRRREAELRRSVDILHVVTDTAVDAMLLLDRRYRVLSVSESLQQLLGIAEADAVGRPVLRGVHEDDEPRVRAALDRALHSGERSAVEFRAAASPTRDAWRWLEARITRAGDADDLRVHVVLRDVTATRLEREELGRKALHDPLTGVLNRAGLDEHLRVHRPVVAAALFVDLDRFKPINDLHGHAAGDMVLREVARRLSTAVRADDAVARIGGDEFVVVCRDGGAVGDAVMTRIRHALAQPYRLDDATEVSVRASIGRAESRPGEGFDELLERADRAMYDDKRRTLTGRR